MRGGVGGVVCDFDFQIVPVADCVVRNTLSSGEFDLNTYKNLSGTRRGNACLNFFQ